MILCLSPGISGPGWADKRCQPEMVLLQTVFLTLEKFPPKGQIVLNHWNGSVDLNQKNINIINFWL